MLNTATPTLQIKTTGADLSGIKEMLITIRTVNLIIVKGNTDIEVDNDLVSVFLTQAESAKLNTGSFNIEIYAINFVGEDVSNDIKMVWTKKGSMSRPTGEGGGGSIDYEILYTKEQVESNTEYGKLVDAMIIKDIYSEIDNSKNKITILGYEDSLIYLNSDTE